MKSIIEYQDYRAYLQEYYEEHKRRFGFTWSLFAKNAGFVSPSYLKLVCQNKANLSEDGIDQVIKAVELSGYEADYFRELVHFNQAKLASVKQRAYDVITEIAKGKKIKVLNEDMLSYFSSWHNAVIREIAPHAPLNARPSNIARQVLPKITAAEVTASLKFLVRSGLLVQNEDGSYSQTDKILTAGSDDLRSIAVRGFHRQMLQLAEKSLDEIPLKDRNISEVVVGITKKNYTQIVKEVADFRKRILAIAAEGDDLDRVYCFQTNLFPLSTKIVERKSDAEDEADET